MSTGSILGRVSVPPDPDLVLLGAARIVLCGIRKSWRVFGIGGWQRPAGDPKVVGIMVRLKVHRRREDDAGSRRGCGVVAQ